MRQVLDFSGETGPGTTRLAGRDDSIGLLPASARTAFTDAPPELHGTATAGSAAPLPEVRRDHGPQRHRRHRRVRRRSHPAAPEDRRDPRPEHQRRGSPHPRDAQRTHHDRRAFGPSCHRLQPFGRPDALHQPQLSGECTARDPQRPRRVLRAARHRPRRGDHGRLRPDAPRGAPGLPLRRTRGPRRPLETGKPGTRKRGRAWIWTGGRHSRPPPHHRRSKIAAMPWPPPMHIVTSAYRPPVRCSS